MSTPGAMDLFVPHVHPERLADLGEIRMNYAITGAAQARGGSDAVHQDDPRMDLAPAMTLVEDRVQHAATADGRETT